MRRGIRRRIFLGGLAMVALLVAMVAMFIGTRPYANPVIAQEPGGQDASFDGISQLIGEARQRGTTLHVLWTHGMCTHDLNWGADRATRIVRALGGVATQTGAIEETAGLTRMLYRFQTRDGEFDATFVIWSPMTRPFKRELYSDGSDSFPYNRATLNGALKTKVNDCLSDAVIYAGQNGDPIRAAMKLAFCREIGGTPATGQPCDLVGATLDRPIALITESLGSKILLDAAQAVYQEAAGARAAISQRFASVQMIYLMANQIPLLDTASAVLPHGSSLGHMIGVMQQARTGLPPDRLSTVAAPTVVSFTDPNDVLSYHLTSTILDVSPARLINVMVSNGTTWLGYLERPDSAHSGYAENEAIIDLIACGHKLGEQIPEAPDLRSSKCP